MKRFLVWLLAFLFIGLFMCKFVFAVDMTPISDTSDLGYLEMAKSAWLYAQTLVSEYKNLPTFSRIFLVTQILLLVFRTPISMFAKQWRYFIIIGLSFAGVIVHKFVLGYNTLDIVGDPIVFSAFQVWLYEGLKNFKKLKG